MVGSLRAHHAVSVVSYGVAGEAERTRWQRGAAVTPLPLARRSQGQRDEAPSLQEATGRPRYKDGELKPRHNLATITLNVPETAKLKQCMRSAEELER